MSFHFALDIIAFPCKMLVSYTSYVMKCTKVLCNRGLLNYLPVNLPHSSLDETLSCADRLETCSTTTEVLTYPETYEREICLH